MTEREKRMLQQKLKQRGLENVIPIRNTEMHPRNLVNLLYMETVPKHCCDDLWKPTFLLLTTLASKSRMP